MKKAFIIGGGIAGLSSAVFLSQKKIPVTLFESSPKFGGRAYSFYDNDLKSELDNGQHILMGCYKETLKFLDFIRASDLLEYQPFLKIPFLVLDEKISNTSHEAYLNAKSKLYPFNLFWALINFPVLSLKERISIIKLFSILPFIKKEELSSLTVKEWLKKVGQSDNAIRSLWEIIAVGAMNCSIEKASAKIFVDILKKIFFNGNFASTIIIPKQGLSKVFVEKSLEYLKLNGGVINSSTPLIEIEIEGNLIKSFTTERERIELTDKDFLILAIPSFAYEKIKGIEKILTSESYQYEYSSILTFHLKINSQKTFKRFYGLINSPLHWVFIKDDILTTVISDANDLISKNKDELFEMIFIELNKYLGINREEIVTFKIIKEKRATFIPFNESLKNRPFQKTKFRNLIIVGDWTNTGLPATIEGAVVSASRGIEKIICKYL